MSDKILFVTTSNLSTNPRLFKELLLARSFGYETYFIGFKLGNWSDEIDLKIIKDYKINNVSYLSATRNPFIPWVTSSLVENLGQKIYPYATKNLKITAFASNKRSFLLKYHLDRLKLKINLIVGHNLGALFPSYSFSRQHNVPFAFDIEDFHPGEIVSFQDRQDEKKRREFLMKSLLKKACYISYASPLIGEYSQNLLGGKDMKNWYHVPNSFSESEFYVPNDRRKEKKIALVWFSQYITNDRGLERLIPVWYKFRDKIELTLIGQLKPQFYRDFLCAYDDFINVLPSMEQRVLHQSLKDYDIGLALEDASVDLNKDIAVSNKLFAYAQAGLYVLATATKGQTMFINSLYQDGLVCDYKEDELVEALNTICNNIESIRNSKERRSKQAKTFSWENESKKLEKIWKGIIT